MNTTLIDQLKKGDRGAMKMLYNSAFAQCASLVMSNNGSREDAKDFFQEALVVLITNLKKPGFELKCAPATYLYSVVRNKWLKRHSKEKKTGLSLIIDNPDYNYVAVAEDEIEEKQELETKHELIAKVLKEQLKEDCRKVIIAFYYKKLSMQEIAEQMDYTAKFAKVKKNRCMGHLRKQVREMTPVQS